MQHIQFFQQDVSFNLPDQPAVCSWIKYVIEEHNKTTGSINYIFTSDDYLNTINNKYLQHDTFTDIITFDQSSEEMMIEADIYVSVQRIEENSKELNISFEEELYRVMIHGILHLLGYNDKTDEEIKEMRKKENHYLALRF